MNTPHAITGAASRSHSPPSWGRRPACPRPLLLLFLFSTLTSVTTSAQSVPPSTALAWPQFAGNRAKTSISDAGPVDLSIPTWTRSTDTAGRTINFVGQSGVAVSREFVLAVGSITISSSKQFNLYAISRRDGSVAWAADIATPYLDSWSTPAIDLAGRTAIVASNTTVAAFDLATGSPRWTAALSSPVVNASPLVTSGHGVGRHGGQHHGGLGIADRVFITEYDGFGNQGRLTCLNADAHHPIANPFQPGQTVWSIEIGGSSGNTPAYDHGLVFVSTTGPGGFGDPGQVLAFPAGAIAAPEPVWVFDNPIAEGFFSGVAVVADSQLAGAPASLYAASYSFTGGRLSANLVKLDAATGQLRWSVPCNRTAATPIALPDGRVLITGGVRGYGTVPTLQLFRDLGSSAQLLWDSAANTWTDTNSNGVMDLGEYLLVGGWSVQPACSIRRTDASTASTLFAGAVPTNPNSAGACTDLYAIDLGKLPLHSPGQAQPGYLAQHYAGAGSSPAIADRNLYTIGSAGLVAFGPPPPRADVNRDGVVDLEDLYAWHRGQGQGDVNADGSITDADRAALEAELRRDEFADIAAGRLP